MQLNLRTAIEDESLEMHRVESRPVWQGAGDK